MFKQFIEHRRRAFILVFLGLVSEVISATTELSNSVLTRQQVWTTHLASGCLENGHVSLPRFDVVTRAVSRCGTRLYEVTRSWSFFSPGGVFEVLFGQLWGGPRLVGGERLDSRWNVLVPPSSERGFWEGWSAVEHH